MTEMKFSQTVYMKLGSHDLIDLDRALLTCIDELIGVDLLSKIKGNVATRL